MADEVSRRNPPGYGKVVVRAITSPLNLGVAATATAGAVALSLWPLAAIGGAAYAALVAWDLVNPDFWKKALGNPKLGSDTLPSPHAVSDPQVRESVKAILAAREELARVLGDTPSDVSEHLAGALVSLEELETRAKRLVSRAEDLSRYLAKSNADPIRKELARLQHRADLASDKQAKLEYEQAVKAREEQLQTLSDIEAAKDRILANLSRIVAALETMPAKVMRMRAMDAEAMDDLSGSMNKELARMNGEIQTFEETLKTISGVMEAAS